MKGVIFAIAIPATIIFVSALSSLLYHWRILPWVVTGIAWVMRRTMRTSGSETLATAANVFMGQTEAPLVVKPYLDGMTRSELMALMVGGMATVAGGVAAAYASLGIDAGHLLTASILSAPGALVIAKLMFPETEKSATADEACELPKSTAANSIDALCRGASDGMRLSINVIAMLIAFVALVYMANSILGWALSWTAWNFTIQEAVGWLNVPFAWLMGVPPDECVRVGAVLGERVVLNEFVGYLHLSGMMEGEGALSPRTSAIATYALCGFANFASVAIQIGGIEHAGAGSPGGLGQARPAGDGRRAAGLLLDGNSGRIVDALAGRLRLRCFRFVGREGEVETCALAKRAFDPGGAAVELGDVLDDAQAEAGAAQFPGACLVHAEEPFKNPIARLGGDAGAVVLHAEVEFAIRIGG